MPAPPFSRRILHHGPSPAGTPVLLSNRGVTGCWFELLRQGGCGAGEIELSDRFNAPRDIEPGDWISLEATAGQRWYLGRVEEVRSLSPAGRRVRLEGMSIQLNEVFPGGFGESADGAKPHRYAATELFTHDPDRSLETADVVAAADELVRLLLTQYVLPATDIDYDPQLIEAPVAAAPVTSLKFRGEESVRSIVKDLALRARGACWGVDASGKFFFLKPPVSIGATYREGRDLTTLAETRDREHLFNRLLLTGDYVYDRRDHSAVVARRSYRWRATFLQPESRARYGDRRLRLWVPWIRTQEDGRSFSREFFRIYSQTTSTYLIETVPQVALPLPWLDCIRLEDREGSIVTTAQVESIRVRFDHAPHFRMELGPPDPRELWPEPPHDERWERPDETPRDGGSVSVTSSGGGGPSDPPPSGGPSSSSPGPSSLSLSESMLGSTHSSGVSSLNSSLASVSLSTNSFGPSSLPPSSAQTSLGSMGTASHDSSVASQPLSSAASSLDSIAPTGSSGLASSSALPGSEPVSMDSQSVDGSPGATTLDSAVGSESSAVSSAPGSIVNSGSSAASDPLTSFSSAGSSLGTLSSSLPPSEGGSIVTTSSAAGESCGAPASGSGAPDTSSAVPSTSGSGG